MSLVRRPRGRVLAAVLAAGLTGGVVEMLPVLPAQAALGASPGRVFQAIAAGLLGKAAFSGGAATVLLGVGLHFAISIVAALVFVLVLLRTAPAERRPIASGLAFGAAAFVVMTFVVVPLSATPFKARPPLPLAALSLVIHMAAFGLPIALVATRLLRPRPAREVRRGASNS